MKILYVVARPLEINASSSIRNRATILGLLENGHSVDLVTTVPDSNHASYDPSLAISNINTLYIKLGGIQHISRLSHKLSFLSGIKNVIYHFLQKKQIYDNLRSMVDHIDEVSLDGYDLIISSSDPKSSHLFVKRLLERKSSDKAIKWVQIWGDPFLKDISANNKDKEKLIKKEESDLLLRADKVIYVSKLTCEEQMRLYPESSKKMTYVPIPFNEEYLTHDYIPGKKINMVYCGDYNSIVRNIIPLYDAVAHSDFLDLTICGNSDIKLNQKDNIHVYSRVPFSKVKELQDNADILVHLSNLQGTQIPGKIYQYSGTNQIILFILDGDSNEIRSQFERYNRYIFTENNRDAIESSLRDIYAGQMQIENKPVEAFSKKHISQQIITDIEG